MITLDEKKFRIRMPTAKEWKRLIEIDNRIETINWNTPCWIEDWSETYPISQSYQESYGQTAGHFSADCFGASLVNCESGIFFRPAFEPLEASALPENIPDGEICTVGTLFMGNKPIVPMGRIDYVHGTNLELRKAEKEVGYHIHAIKAGNVLISAYALLNNISYNDIYEIFYS